MAFNEKEFLDLCKKYDSIYVYGAGKKAAALYPILRKLGIKVSGFYVSEMKNNPEKIFNLPVMPISSYDPARNSLIIVSIPGSVGGKMHKEIFNFLVRNKINNIYFITHDIFYWLAQKAQKQNEENWKKNDAKYRKEVEQKRKKSKKMVNFGDYRIIENLPVEYAHSLFGLKNQSRLCHWRIRYIDMINSGFQNISEAFKTKSAIAEFENQFGAYNIYKTIPNEKNKSATCSVFMATSHLSHYFTAGYNKYSWIIPIQVGAALTKEHVCDIKDNWGEENISERNSIYSEATGIYWMWKHAPKTDYIGLCHYRRHFDVKENMPHMLAANSIDVLTTSPSFVFDSIGDFFINFVPRSDLDAMLEAIRIENPDYYETGKKFLESRFFPPCNLFVMRYEIFQEYASFLFSTTFAIERFYSERNFYRNDRYMGFLVENLMGIFLMKNKDRLKIAYTDMVFY